MVLRLKEKYMIKEDKVLNIQQNMVTSFEESNGLSRRRLDTAQIWIDKSHNIANAVIRKRSWTCGVLIYDFLQTIFNDDTKNTGSVGFTKK